MGDMARMDRNARFMTAFNDVAVKACNMQVGDTFKVTEVCLGELEGWTAGIHMFARLERSDGCKFDVTLYEYGEMFEPDDCDVNEIVDRVSRLLGISKKKVRAILKEAKLDG